MWHGGLSEFSCISFLFHKSEAAPPEGFGLNRFLYYIAAGKFARDLKGCGKWEAPG
jgi:hypothetical protein